MASVRQKSGSASWFACYRLPTGRIDAKGRPVFRRVQRSTGTEDRSRALQLAISYERIAELAAEKQLTERAARAFLAEVSAISAISLRDVEPLDGFLRRWLTARGPSLAAHSRERYALAVTQFLEFLGDRQRAPLAEITARHVAEFRDVQVAAGKSPATVNKALGILGMAFAEAAAQHLLEGNPARGLNVRGAKRARQHRRPFTFEQFSALVAATDGDWRTFILLGGYTGARQQEAARLTWGQIEFAAGRLYLDRTKTADAHALPLHPALAEHLRARWRAAGRPRSGPVLPYLSTLRRRAISNYFRRDILPRIGLAQPFVPRSAERGAARALAPYSFHSLRHSLSTWLAAAGVDEMMRMRLIGHEDTSVNRGYTHTQLEQARAALARVPALAPPPGHK